MLPIHTNHLPLLLSDLIFLTESSTETTPLDPSHTMHLQFKKKNGSTRYFQATLNQTLQFPVKLQEIDLPLIRNRG